ncbi:ABC transporter permease [Nocardioides sp.]|uniref:ABC transporter permease n=1 Tax=Nocardioides sp. TaxID=35761 RepID=UPI0019B831CB|nr:ABC transporter permease [Nocardioides sp.]MBC7276575.1 ABC transporter permease [Nocardioides sp.]
MWAYVVRRCLVGVALIMALTLITFALFFASPVDPARFACGKNCSAEQRDVTRAALGYDKPFVVQWAGYLKGLAVGRDFPLDAEQRAAAPDQVTHCAAPCLGYSHLDSKTVNEMVADALPITASLAIVALVMWLIGGVLFGILAAIHQGSLIDRGVVGGTLVIYAFPSFAIAVFLLQYVAVKWGIVPLPRYTEIADGGLWAWFSNLLLPALTLALLYLAGYVRMTRAFVLESLSEDYIRTAKAKGLKSRTVVFKHALRAALTPLVTMTGLDFASLLGGAIITERVFTYHGLGMLTVDANNSSDLAVLVGIVLLAGMIVIIANIVVDVLYAYIDPRVKVA